MASVSNYPEYDYLGVCEYEPKEVCIDIEGFQPGEIGRNCNIIKVEGGMQSNDIIWLKWVIASIRPV